MHKPTITLTRARVGGPVSIAAIDRAGNVGPSLVVARGTRPLTNRPADARDVSAGAGGVR